MKEKREIYKNLEKYADREELVSCIKYLKSKGIIDKSNTKKLDMYDLVMFFLESVEAIVPKSDMERLILMDNQPLVKLYNKLAEKIEKDDVQFMTENLLINSQEKKVPNEVQVVENFSSGKLIQKDNDGNKITYKEFKDYVFKKRNLLGIKINDAIGHDVCKWAVKGKTRGFIKEKLGITGKEIKNVIDNIDRTKIEVITEGVKDDKVYTFIRI